MIFKDIIDQHTSTSKVTLNEENHLQWTKSAELETKPLKNTETIKFPVERFRFFFGEFVFPTNVAISRRLKLVA